MNKFPGVAAVLLLTGLLADGVRAEAPQWRYTLIEGSTLLDECPPCARPSIAIPLRGGCDVSQEPTPTPLSRFRLENIRFTAGSPGGRIYKVTGHGVYEIMAEVAIRQTLTLEVDIDDGTQARHCLFSSDPSTPTRSWPMVLAGTDQTNGTFTPVYHLVLAAAPFRELWFSTPGGMHNGNWSEPTNFVSAGDLLSVEGRIVRRNQDIVGRLGVMPPTPDLGLDAVQVLAGGEIAFSIPQAVFSETLGAIQAGDLLSDRGRILATNPKLASAFRIKQPAGDLGLDAVAVRESGEIWFSLATDATSSALGTPLGHGDLLSNKGTIVRRNKDLIARFHPTGPIGDLGLDAIHVWPGGEIWFSTTAGFTDSVLGSVGSGDVLSDAGYIVMRNPELVSRFSPLEDLANFGLDALYVVTDLSDALPPTLLVPGRLPAPPSVRLEWKGPGAVFQVERAASLPGPFLPVSPILPDTIFTDSNVPPSGQAAYYRVRQW